MGQVILEAAQTQRQVRWPLPADHSDALFGGLAGRPGMTRDDRGVVPLPGQLRGHVVNEALVAAAHLRPVGEVQQRRAQRTVGTHSIGVR